MDYLPRILAEYMAEDPVTTGLGLVVSLLCTLALVSLPSITGSNNAKSKE